MVDQDITSLSMAVGKVIKQKRQGLAMSQEQFAEQAGVHRTFLTDVERGARNISLFTLQKLAKPLEIPASAVLAAAEELMGDGLEFRALLLGESIRTWTENPKPTLVEVADHRP